MEIKATMVKELRDKTGAGMMDAKKALVETDGDMEKAMELLKSKIFAREEAMRQAQEKGRSIAATTANEWGSQMRSYVLHPYKMVKDHRTGHESGNPEAVLKGALDDFIDAARQGAVQ